MENLKWKIAGNEITFISSDKDEKSVTFSNSRIYILKFNETFAVLTINEKKRRMLWFAFEVIQHPLTVTTDLGNKLMGSWFYTLKVTI